jgi:hypothetical protein
MFVSESRKIIYVPMRVIPRDSVPQPKSLPSAQVLMEDRFHVSSRQAGVPRLDRAEQALFRRQERTNAVHVDGAAFQNNAFSIPFGTPGSKLEAVRDGVRHRSVVR